MLKSVVDNPKPLNSSSLQFRSRMVFHKLTTNKTLDADKTQILHDTYHVLPIADKSC